MVLWDLREPPSMHTHHSQRQECEGPVLRVPTYSTGRSSSLLPPPLILTLSPSSSLAGLMGFTGHTQPVTHLTAVSTGAHPSHSEGELTVPQDGTSSLLSYLRGRSALVPASIPGQQWAAGLVGGSRTASL